MALCVVAWTQEPCSTPVAADFEIVFFSKCIAEGMDECTVLADETCLESLVYFQRVRRFSGVGIDSVRCTQRKMIQLGHHAALSTE